MRKYSLSLIVPVYNEELLLEEFVVEAIANLKKVSDDFEIILVNDGSTDKTSTILKQLKQNHRCLRIINLDRNMGVGAATRIGLKAASKEIIFNNTVDAFFDYKDLPKFLHYLNEYDIISGYRLNLKSNNLYGKILTLGNYFLIRFLFQLNLKAFQTVQFLKKDFLNKIEIESSTTFIAPEILIKAHKLGYKIKEIGTEYRKRKAGKGKCGKPINVLKSVKEIFYFWFKWNISGLINCFKLFFIKHYLVIIFAILVGAISVSQQLMSIHSLGGEYNGVPLFNGPNVDVYLAKMREIMDGHGWVSSSYFFEYKNLIPLVWPIGEYIYALPSILTGASIMNTLILDQFLFPTILFLLAYFLILKLTTGQNLLAAKINALGGGLLVIFGYDFTDVKHTWLMLSGKEEAMHALLWNRPVNPITGAVLFFILLLFLWQIINKKQRFLFLPGGITLALTLGYFFTWSLSMSILFVLLVIYLIKKEHKIAVNLFLTALFSFLISSPFWYNVLEMFSSGSKENKVELYGGFLNRTPVFNKVLLVGLFIFVLCLIREYYLKRKTAGKIENWWWFCLALFLGGAVAFNQQVISGINIWHHHFVQYTIPAVIIAMMVLFFNFFRPLYSKIWLGTVVIIFIITLSYGILTARSHVFVSGDFRKMQEYNQMLKLINVIASKDCVILVAEEGDKIARLIPSLTHCNVYKAPGGYDLEVPPERKYHNFLSYLRINEIEPNVVGDYLKTNYSLISENFFKDWSQLFSPAYSGWMDEVVKRVAADYSNFVEKDFEKELKKFRIDYILSEKKLSQSVFQSLTSLVFLYNINGLYLYQFK